MIKCKNPTGVYVVGPSGQLVKRPVHVDPGAEWPASVALKASWRFANADDIAKAEKKAAEANRREGK